MDRRPDRAASGLDEMRPGAPARTGGPRFTPRTYEPRPPSAPQPGRRRVWTRESIILASYP